MKLGILRFFTASVSRLLRNLASIRKIYRGRYENFLFVWGNKGISGTIVIVFAQARILQQNFLYLLLSCRDVGGEA